jgi:hypothetical protein
MDLFSGTSGQEHSFYASANNLSPAAQQRERIWQAKTCSFAKACAIFDNLVKCHADRMNARGGLLGGPIEPHEITDRALMRPLRTWRAPSGRPQGAANGPVCASIDRPIIGSTNRPEPF